MKAVLKSSSALTRALGVARSNKTVALRCVGPVFTGYRCNITTTSSNSELPGSNLKDSLPDFADVPGVQSAGEKMIIMFTCTVCDTRSARKISKSAYNHGIVMVRCNGCNNRHLIADRMGVFEDAIPTDGSSSRGGWDIQKYLSKQMGVQSKHITDENVFELTMEDILGAKAAAELKTDDVGTGNGSIGDSGEKK